MLEKSQTDMLELGRRSSAALGQAPLRIAFLCYRSTPHVGGQGVFLRQAARALAERGAKVDILSGPPYPETPPGVRLIKLPSLDLYAQPNKGYLALRWRHLPHGPDVKEYLGHVSGKFMEPETFADRAATYLRKHRGDYDIVLDNQTLAYGLLRIERSGLPVVAIAHHPIRRDLELALEMEDNWAQRALLKRWYAFLSMQEYVAPRLRRVIVESESARGDIETYLGVPPARMTKVFLGVDPIFRPQPEVARHPLRLVTTASADMPLKGLVYLIEAFDQLSAKWERLELIVVGRLREGPTKALLAQRGLENRVRFVHGLSGEELAQLYASAALCVTPSLYEGFGLPAAEAMCCGAPVIVTDGGALPEVVGTAGSVVPRADARALAEKIDELLGDEQRRAEMGAASLARAPLFDWARAAAAYEDILREELARC